MDKIDLKKTLKHLYQPRASEVVEVNVPPMNFLMVDGQGDPNTSKDYSAAVESLFGLSYTLKFMVKKGASAVDYAVMPLEGLWWADDMAKFSTTDRSKWKWTAMIMQPEFVTKALVSDALAEVRRKKNLEALSRLRFETFNEGRSAQTLHVGPFSDEEPTIQRVHAFIADAGRMRTGKHHEIYLSDIRKADPAKWKTVIRQPMQ
jgi:hypothetical protein